MPFCGTNLTAETARLHAAYPSKIMLLRYEDLVRDTENGCQACQCQNIGFDKAMPTPHQNLETQAKPTKYRSNRSR
ncbi:MAG: hypothetical protein IPN94_13630 [Sphingobacteriales bacterium]|nr:hypothetical protein [Sphingobacteriales bacterium]